MRQQQPQASTSALGLLTLPSRTAATEVASRGAVRAECGSLPVVRVDTVRAPLIQRVGKVEAPAARSWDLHRTSSLLLTSSDRGRRPLRLRVGSLDVATLPTPPVLTIVADDGEGAVSLSAAAVRMGSHCDDAWIFVGEVLDGSGTRDVRANVVYHGVQRHGDKAYVRLTGTVETPAARRRWRRRPEFALAVDLLFGASAVEARAATR